MTELKGRVCTAILYVYRLPHWLYPRVMAAGAILMVSISIDISAHTEICNCVRIARTETHA